MQINLSTTLHTLRGETQMRPESSSDDAKLVPMTLGYLICESLPKAIGLHATETEKINMVKLQRRALKEDTQEFSAEEIALMKKGVFQYVSPEFSFIAVEAADILEGKI